MTSFKTLPCFSVMASAKLIISSIREGLKLATTGKRIFAIGGADVDADDNVEEYHYDTDTWSILDEKPLDKVRWAAGAAVPRSYFGSMCSAGTR